MATFFNEYFDIAEEELEAFGAFNVSLVNDLPLFIDPFLLFHSEKPEYQQLHDEIIRYLVFLRDRASQESINDDLLNSFGLESCVNPFLFRPPICQIRAFRAFWPLPKRRASA